VPKVGKGNSSTPELRIKYLILSPDGMNPKALRQETKILSRTFLNLFENYLKIFWLWELMG